MTSASNTIPALGDDPFVISGRMIARHALGEILFADPRATRRIMARGATPLLVQSEAGFAFHLVRMGQPLACLLPWDEPVARDPLTTLVDPMDPDSVLTEAKAWERARWKVARAREHAVWLTPQEVLAHIDRMETVDGTRLTRQFVQDPETLRLQLRVALQSAADMEICAEDIVTLLAQGDDGVRAWAMRWASRLKWLPTSRGQSSSGSSQSL